MLGNVEERKVIRKKPATYQDVLDAPDHLIAEILDGELFLSPRPALPHQAATSRLSTILGTAFDLGRGGPGGWHILYEPELHLGPDILVPDLAGWRRQRMPDIPDAAFMSVAPDWACEVVSPSSSRIDRAKKLPIYARERVSHLWLVHPLKQTLEVFRLTDGKLAPAGFFAHNEIARIEPFEQIELELSLLWPKVAARSK